jgi:hypothetical protein
MKPLFNVNELLYGQDPELCVINIKTNKPVIVPLPGSKAEPHQVTKDVSVQPDGAAFEMCVTPTKTAEEFVAMHMNALTVGNAFVKNINPELALVGMSSAHYPMSDLKANPHCLEFGCSPSYCVYTGMSFDIPPASSTTLRTFGSHIMCGWKGNMEEIPDFYKHVESIIKCCDLFLGIPSLLLDKDAERRQLYGKAGDFRVKQLGDNIVLEYRSLGGFFNKNEELTRWKITNFIKALEYYIQNPDIPDIIECEDTIRHAIDNNDLTYVNSIVKIFKLEVPNLKTANYATV